MSLGLFTLDSASNVWFYNDCVGNPIPKHFVFNIQGLPTDRVLVLFTGYIYDPNEVGLQILIRPHVLPGDFRLGLEDHLAINVGNWIQFRERNGYLRIVYKVNSQWVFDEVEWSASNLPGQRANFGVVLTNAAVPMQVNTLYCIGEGAGAAQTDWRQTGNLGIGARLDSALKAAFTAGENVCIPHVRRPVMLSACVRHYAAGNGILT